MKSLPIFLLCGVAAENRGRLFFECGYSTDVWLSFFARNGLLPPTSFHDLTIWLTSPAIDKNLKPLILLTFQTVMYFLWKERNSRLHNLVNRPYHILIRDMSSNSCSITGSRQRNCYRQPATSHRGRPTYLSLWFAHFQD